jgi:stress response protein YsnF
MQNRRGSAGDPAQSEEFVVPILEEKARVEKRRVTTGKVRIRSIVEDVEEIAAATLEEETVDITRVPVDRVVDEVPAVRTEDGVTIVPILEEVLFVEKRLVLKEELHIRRRVSTETVEVPIELRKGRAVVERVAPEGDILSDEESTDDV